MSFDLFLQAFDAGESAQVDRVKVLQILRRHCRDSADKFGFYLVEFADGSHVEFSAKGLEADGDFTGCAFHVRGFSPDIVGFMFEIARAGNMVVLNAQGNDTLQNPFAILTAQEQSLHLPNGVATNPVVCCSGLHLAELLGMGFANWEEYRDLVVGKANNP